MKTVPGFAIGQQLCKVLGLEGHFVKRLVIDVTPDEPVTVYVEELLREEQVEPLLEVLAEAKPEIVTVESLGVEQPKITTEPV